MIQNTLYFLIIYLFTTPTLIYYGNIPNAAGWLVDVIAIVFIPVVLIYAAIQKKIYAPLSYLVLILLSLFIVGISFIYNQSSASALILGLRYHFTYLPFLLLPLVYNFTEKEIKKILWLVCVLLIIQAPVAFLQRFVWFPHLNTGDVIRGTLGGSGTLSVMLVSAISILHSFCLAKQITLRAFIILSAFLLFPTLINETKITFIILPIALSISTLLFGDKNYLYKFKQIGIGFLCITIFVFMFIKLYDAIYASQYGSIKTLLQREIQGEGYMYYGDKAANRIEDGFTIGRLDSIMFALENISIDTGTFFIGIGIGNSLFEKKISFLKIENEDIKKYKPEMTTISNVLWELGVSGLIIQLAFLILIFKDALSMRKEKFFFGVFCLCWCSVIGIRLIILFYHNVINRPAYDLIFWLFAGIVISKKYQFKVKAHNQQSHVFELFNKRYGTAKS
jgi:hypothetical protein